MCGAFYRISGRHIRKIYQEDISGRRGIDPPHLLLGIDNTVTGLARFVFADSDNSDFFALGESSALFFCIEPAIQLCLRLQLDGPGLPHDSGVGVDSIDGL